MSGSPASASVETAERILVCGVNWLGDAIMTMPALQALREHRDRAEVTLLVKEALRPLWELHPVPDHIISYTDSWAGTLHAGRQLRAAGFDRACVFPNSFRSALIPRLARIATRRGVAMHGRGALITDKVELGDLANRHQACEYFRLLDLPVPAQLPQPGLDIGEIHCREAASLLENLPQPRVALLPGAARGPGKQWPENHWLELADRLVDRTRAGVVCLGTAAEQAMGSRIANRCPDRIRNLAGRTSLGAFAAVLQACSAAVANDSGGMHLAAAAGTPVIALFGITDPVRTGPLGGRAVVLQHSAHRARDVPRDSEEGRTAMAAIRPDEVFEHLKEPLGS